MVLKFQNTLGEKVTVMNYLGKKRGKRKLSNQIYGIDIFEKRAETYKAITHDIVVM